MSKPVSNNLWSVLQPTLKNQHKPAFITNQTPLPITHCEIHTAALATAIALRSHGIRRGDSVGIFASGGYFAIAALAVWRLGGVIAPLHIGYSDFELRQQIKNLAPKIILTNKPPRDHFNKYIAIERHSEAISTELEKSVVGGDDDVAARLYTSGSTGNAKIVQLSHANIIFNIHSAAGLQSFSSADRFLALLPESHAMGLLGNILLPIYCGGAAVYPRELTAAEIIATLAAEKISVIIAVPKLFRNIMLGLQKRFDHGGAAMRIYLTLLKRMPIFIRTILNAPIRKKLGGRVKVWVSGGSALDPRILNFYHNLGLPLRQGYGLTETAPLVSMQTNFDRAYESVGLPIPGVNIKIDNPDENGYGEICIQGKNVMRGYEDAIQTAKVMKNSWFHSGDLGFIKGGRIFISGRQKRLIVTEAGKNVYPEELETLLERNSKVSEAAVLEINARPACILVIADDALPKNQSAPAREILVKFNKLVSSHNRISRVAVVEKLPRTPLGKIALQQLPEIFKANEIK